MDGHVYRAIDRMCGAKLLLATFRFLSATGTESSIELRTVMYGGALVRRWHVGYLKTAVTELRMVVAWLQSASEYCPSSWWRTLDLR